MIVFDLQCASGHRFEGWFGSSAGFAEQQAAGLLCCAVCGSSEVEKAVMAPNVAAKGNRTASVPPQSPAEAVQRAIAAIAQVQAEALANSRWVGGGFAREARAMHSGEAPAAPIHGSATPDEARALVEEGVEIAPLLVPVVPPEERN